MSRPSGGYEAVLSGYIYTYNGSVTDAVTTRRLVMAATASHQEESSRKAALLTCGFSLSLSLVKATIKNLSKVC